MQAPCVASLQTLFEVAVIICVFRLIFAFDFFNLLLLKFHQAGMIIVKHLIQKNSNEASVGVEPSTLRSLPL